MTQPWQYDETEQIGTDYRAPSEVAAYDARMQKLRDVHAEAEEIHRRLRLTPNSTVWEIGTGTGECALALAAGVKQVHAADVSPAMLAWAQQKADQRGIRNVSFIQGGFLSGNRPDQPVDGIVTQLALHHLPDFWKSRALAEMASRLRPGGRLYLRDIVFPAPMDDYDGFFAKVIEEVRARTDDETARQTVEHIKREYSTLDWILEGMLARSGLHIVFHDRKGFLSVYVCEK